MIFRLIIIMLFIFKMLYSSDIATLLKTRLKVSLDAKVCNMHCINGYDLMACFYTYLIVLLLRYQLLSIVE